MTRPAISGDIKKIKPIPRRPTIYLKGLMGYFPRVLFIYLDIFATLLPPFARLPRLLSILPLACKPDCNGFGVGLASSDQPSCEAQFSGFSVSQGEEGTRARKV